MADTSEPPRRGTAPPAGSTAASGASNTGPKTTADPRTDAKPGAKSGAEPGARSGSGSGSLWTSLGKIGTVLGLCSFAFGIGTFSDLRNRWFPAPSRSAGIVASRKAYVDASDYVCVRYVARATPAPSPLTYRWMSDTLTLRRAMARAWPTPDGGGSWGADVAKAQSDFTAADAYWAAAAAALKADDVAYYNTAIGLFDAATGTVVREVRRLGFRNCGMGWYGAPPWQPTN
ncbi:hypothetical protein AB0I55_27495 [Actinocatenispora sera]|uniref:hypothetical protein n=1 Tax=Actinocatenispora sera TaxID=390989 RepID=UPI0033C76359